MRHKLIHIGLINRSVVLTLLLIATGSISAQGVSPQLPPLQKGHTLAVLEVEWSPNDKLLLTYSAADGFLNVWQMPHAKLIASMQDSAIRIAGSDTRYLRTFSWSNDSRRVATGSENGTAQVWEAETGKLLWSTRIADENVTAVGFSNDAKYVAAVASPEDEDHKLILLDADTGAVIKSLGTIEHRFLTFYHHAKVIFSEDNKLLVVADIGGRVTRWDLGNGSLLSTRHFDLCGAERRSPNSFAYSDDLSLVVARCGVKTNVLDVNTGVMLRQIPNDWDHPASVVISHNKELLAIGDKGAMKLFNLTDGKETLVDADLPITCGCAFNKDNSLLAMQESLNSKVVRVFDLNTKRTFARLEAHPGQINALAFSPDGSVVSSGSEDRIVRIWDAQTGALLKSLEGHEKEVLALAFSPDGKLLVSAGADETVRVWNVTTANLDRTIQLSSEVSSIAFSRDGQRVVITHDETVTLWDSKTWSPIRPFRTEESHTSGNRGWCCGSTAQAAYFDARGELIVSGHADGTIKVWDPRPKKPLPDPFSELITVLKTAESNQGFSLSPNEKFLVVNDGEKPPRIWNWSTRKPLRRLGEDATYTHAVVFSPDSRIVGTSDIGGSIYLWNVRTGKLLRELDNGDSSDDALAFSPDGTKLASGGKNQNLIMWDVKTGARLWHILPVTERHRPTAEEVAARERAIALAAAEEKLKNQVTRKLANRISVGFSHYGEPNDPMAARFGETGRPGNSLIRESKSEATGIWLRLRNTSRLPIGLSTASHYFMSDKSCGYQTKRKFFPGLCNDSEIGILFGVIDRQGKLTSDGFHVRFFSILPPKTSVLFSVPRELLRDGRSIVFSYNFLNEDAKGKLVEYGKARELRFKQ